MFLLIYLLGPPIIFTVLSLPLLGIVWLMDRRRARTTRARNANTDFDAVASAEALLKSR